MLQLKPLDSNVPIFQQVGTDLSPVILVNVFQVAEADIPALLKAWEADANWMKQQPGYISTQLHRGIAGSSVFMNYAVWESVAHFRAAFNHPDFKKALAILPTVAEFHTNQGRALASMGKFDDSLEAFNEARRIAPKDHSPLKYMGMALLKLNKVPDALGCFDEALKLGSNDRDVWTGRAKAAEAMGNKEEAVRLLEYLARDAAQTWYAETNGEFPVRPEVPVSATLAAWGKFKPDSLNLERLGELNGEAVRLMDRAGWK